MRLRWGGTPMISHPMQQYQVPPQPQTAYAGFWIRFIARFVDGLILGIPLTIILFIFIAISGVALTATSSDQNAQNATAGVASGAFLLFYVIALVAIAGYQIYFWGTNGQTIACACSTSGWLTPTPEPRSVSAVRLCAG